MCGHRFSQQAFLLFSTCVSIMISPPLSAQEAGLQTEVKVTSEAVRLDVVVRDKKGRPILDLSPDEIQVFENGRRQEILWLHTAAKSAGGRNENLGQQALSSLGWKEGRSHLTNLVSIVFDDLSPDASNLARIAAIDFVERFAGPDLPVAIFNCERRLIALSPFIHDIPSLKRAINEATAQTPLKYYKKSEEIFERASEQSSTQEQLSESAGEPGTASPGVIPEDIDARMAAVIANNLRFSAQVDRELGSRSIYSLLALLQGMDSLEGRKTVVYFSEGVFLGSNFDKLFRTLIGDANRKNVSFYCVDARGLSSASQLAAAAVALKAAVGTSMAQQAKPAGEAVTAAEVGLPDSAQSIHRLNLQAVLQELAESTGGRLIAETNDFREGLRKVGEDIASYYEIVYAPSELRYDGTFRKIEVKVDRPGVEVQSRTGYFALPPRGDFAIMPSDVDLLEALNSGSSGNPLDIQLGLFRFAPGLAGYRHSLFVSIPLEKLPLDSQQGLLDVDYITLITDERGDLVAKTSGRHQLSHLAGTEKAPIGRTLNIVDKVILKPGRYSVRAAVRTFDPSVFSVNTLAEVEVPVFSKGVGLSDLVIVGYAEEPEDPPDKSDPLYYQNVLLVPNLTRLLSETDNQLAVFFRIYPGDTPRSALKARLDFLRSEEMVGSTELEIPEADPDGSIPLLSIFPLTTFPPGTTSALRLRIEGGPFRATETAAFSVMP